MQAALVQQQLHLIWAECQALHARCKLVDRVQCACAVLQLVGCRWHAELYLSLCHQELSMRKARLLTKCCLNALHTPDLVTIMQNEPLTCTDMITMLLLLLLLLLLCANRGLLLTFSAHAQPKSHRFMP